MFMHGAMEDIYLVKIWRYNVYLTVVLLTLFGNRNKICVYFLVTEIILC